MNNIKLRVTANRLELIEDTYTTGGSVNYDGCEFDFDTTWDGFTRTAVFGFGNSDYYRVEIDEDGKCKIPAVCLQQEGILKIGVYGIKGEEIVLTTNNVAHRIDEGICDVGVWIEEDGYFVYNAVEKLEGSIEKYKQALDERFNSLLKMLRENGTISNGDNLTGTPIDWYIPNAFTDAANLPSSSKSSEYGEYLDYTLNKLTDEFPDYVSSIEIGMDSSNVYPIYAYTFEPLHYEKTVLVSACFRGSMSISLIALSNFLDELCRNSSGDSTLAFIRSGVKLIVIPTANPYGLVSGKTNNANGVDINSNFPYKWEECISEKKGEVPADQQETEALINFVNTVSSDKLCAAIDFEAKTNLFSSKMVFYPRFMQNCTRAIGEAVNRYNYKKHSSGGIYANAVIAPSIKPSFMNYLAYTYGINTCTAVWPPINNGGAGTNEGVTNFTEFIGNIIYTMSKNSTFTLSYTKAPFTKYFSWRSSSENDVFSIPFAEALQKAAISSYEMLTESPCNITLSGYAVIKADSECTVKINPLLWQECSPEQTFEDRVNMSDFILEIPLSVGIHIVPINSVLQGYCGTVNEYDEPYYPEKIKFCLALSCSSEDSASLTGFSVTLNAFQSDAAKPVEITRPVGAAGDYIGDDVPTQELIYPLGIVTENDVNYDA